FPNRPVELRPEFQFIETGSRKAFGQFPALGRNRLHARAAVILAKQSRQPATVIGVLLVEQPSTAAADIEARQPTRQAYGPESEVAERQSPVGAPFNLAHGEQDQPEHGF